MKRLLLGLGWIAACGSAAAGELRITPLELPGQAQPSIATVRDGFVLTTIDRSEGAAIQRFTHLDPQGRVLAQGEISRGTDWFVNWADFPSLVEADNGDWVTFHLRKSDPDLPYAYDVRLVRSTDQGRTWSAPWTVHTDGTPTEHGFVTLLPAGEAQVLVAWLDGRHGAANAAGHDHHGGARTSLQAALVGREPRVLEAFEVDSLTCDCCTTDGRRLGDTTWLVYRDRTEAEIRDLRFVRFDGTAFSAPAPVLPDEWFMPGCPVNGPSVASLDGDPLVVWPTVRDGQPAIRLARHAGGAWLSLGDLEAGADVQGRVDVVALGRHEALVSWIGLRDGETVLKVARVDRSGKPGPAEVVTAIAPGRNTGMPRMAARGRTALLAWTEGAAGGPRVRAVRIDTTE